MKLLPTVIIILLVCSLCLTTCGIDEYFYLPGIYYEQLSDIDISITLPKIDSDFYYASKFSIFYKIYLSNVEVTGFNFTPETMRSINPQLAIDYNSLSRFIDITTTDIPMATDLSSRQFYELQFEDRNLLKISPPATGSTDEVNLYIEFPPVGSAFVETDGNPKGLILRNNGFEHSPDSEFYDSEDIKSNDNAGAANTSSKTHNWDVYPESIIATGTANFAYVSMYIAIQGTNPINFTSIFSKLTHLGIYMLPR